MSKRPDDLHVIVSDIQAAAETFRIESSDYRSGMPYDGANVPFGCPRAGTALTDHILENTLRMIGQLHAQIGQAMENHAFRLHKAGEYYSAAENEASVLIADIFNNAETTVLPPEEPQFN